MVCFFGDGGINQGVVFEAMNMAAIWKLPVLFVCENNLYALSTPAEKMTALKQLADRAQGFGFPGYQVPGNDLRAVVKATREALDRARAGQGPTLLECKTYRWYGHSAMRPDTRAYRAREEELEWRERDPVALAERELGKAGVLSAERDRPDPAGDREGDRGRRRVRRALPRSRPAGDLHRRLRAVLTDTMRRRRLRCTH